MAAKQSIFSWEDGNFFPLNGMRIHLDFRKEIWASDYELDLFLENPSENN